MPLLEVDELTFTYPPGVVALDGVSLYVDDGECVGLIGPNGAGKSTLLWHLNGLLPAREGTAGRVRVGQGRAGQGRGARASVVQPPVAVRVAGLEVAPANFAEVRRLVGLVFQDPDDQLFCPTLEEDIAFGPLNLDLPADEVRQRVGDALAAVGLEGLERRMPHQLSLGQRKRACLAGVLACRPRLIALDEPTANLDPRARRQLIDLLGSLDCARLIASHDLEMILELCSRVIVLDDGRVRTAGVARDILGDERLLTAHGLEMPASLREAVKNEP